MNRFGSVYLALYIGTILLDRFDIVDSVLLFWFGQFGSIDFIWYIWFSTEGRKFGLVDLVWCIWFGKLGFGS